MGGNTESQKSRQGARPDKRVEHRQAMAHPPRRGARLLPPQTSSSQGEQNMRSRGESQVRGFVCHPESPGGDGTWGGGSGGGSARVRVLSQPPGPQSSLGHLSDGPLLGIISTFPSECPLAAGRDVCRGNETVHLGIRNPSERPCCFKVWAAGHWFGEGGKESRRKGHLASNRLRVFWSCCPHVAEVKRGPQAHQHPLQSEARRAFRSTSLTCSASLCLVPQNMFAFTAQF